MTQLPGMASQSSYMQKRASSRASLDFFPTPPWATRALCEKIQFFLRGTSVWEPACGRYDMVRPLSEYAEMVFPSDVIDYGNGNLVIDFLNPDASPVQCDWIITNPPFKAARKFIILSLGRASNVAMLVRTNLLEGQMRYKTIYWDNPPTRTLQFVERVPMFKDKLDPDRSTHTAYMWLVWIKDHPRQPMEWIEPCRSRLEKPGDYDQYATPLPLLTDR